MLAQYLPRWIFLLVVVAFNLLIALKTSIGVFYFLFWFLLSISALSLLWAAAAYLGSGLTLKRIVTDRAEEGGALHLEIEVRNTGHFPIFNAVAADNLTCAEAAEAKKWILVEFLLPRFSHAYKYSCLCSKRGLYKLGPLAVYFFDPLGLFFFRRRYPASYELFVYPRTFPIEKFPPLIKGTLPWFGIESKKVSGDDDEFYGIREYKEGDPIRRVHWLSTARKNQLIVKQFQRQTFYRATLVFALEKGTNFGKGKESVAEYIVRLAASTAKYLIDKDISLELIASAHKLVHLPSNKGREHLEDILRFLTMAKAESELGLGEILEEFSHFTPDDSSLIVLMLDKDWEYLPLMLPLEKRNVSLVPLILVSSTFQYAFDQRELVRDIKTKISKQYKISPIVISRGDNLQEIFSR
ncbi:MAG: DUF58 domain-containing protein [Candidatus Omnitrophota bacterium]|nr:DUF58 domain-containing protein [Candidatus Omnitrophota bacterium]